MGIVRGGGVLLTVNLLRLAVLLGACTPEGKPPMFTNLLRGEVGGACDTDADCKSGTCLLNSFLGYSGASVGGYCSSGCSADVDCNPGKCAAGRDANYCVARCEKPAHCRDGYICDAVESYCEPAAVLEPACDPHVADCTTFDNRPGGCIRGGLGDGNVGFCLPTCSLDGSMACPAGRSCHLYDVRNGGQAFENDAFRSLACVINSPTQSVAGGDCTYLGDCVNLTDCVHFAGSGFCLPTCDLFLSSCVCNDYKIPNPTYGYCSP